MFKFIIIISEGTNWTLHKSINCKVETGAAILSKVQNNALENDPADCKWACKLEDGCVGFIQKLSSACLNLKHIDLKNCMPDEGINLFLNGRYTGSPCTLNTDYFSKFSTRFVGMIRLPVIT